MGITKGLYGVLLLPLLILGACERSQEAAGTGTGAAQDTSPETALSGGWKNTQQQRRSQLERYLQQEEIAYRWFADFPFGLNDGVPYIILKLLPRLAPELWGSEENFLEPVGLFHDQRLPDYPIARGVGWSGLGRDDFNGAIDYASFTCGACHIGRVRTNDGIQYLDGGVNAHFNLPSTGLGCSRL